jgi:hypothetical protein
MRRYKCALAIFALAIALAIGFYSTLPMQNGGIANANPVALAIPTGTMTPLPTQESAATRAEVQAESLHVRSSPMGLRIGYLHHADTVTLTNLCKDGWAQIIWRAGKAWVNAKYLSDNICKE